MTFSVDPMDVILPILRDTLPGILGHDVAIMSRVPDGVPTFVPLVVVRRTGGSSIAPDLYDRPWLNFQHWAGPTETVDAARNAHNLADATRQALWQAWRQQLTTPAGHIVHLRESSAPEEINDPDVPHYARYMATYEIRIRRNPLAP